MPRWVFRLAASALPLLLLILVEVTLRCVGFGYPTAFWLKRTHGSNSFWVANDEFTRPYFPPGLARTPQPLVLPPTKPADSWRIFIFGESAALGDPEPAYGFGRVLEVLLAARHPERSVEVVNVGITAINSHVIRRIAKDCAAREGDLWVLYIGNNEVVGPFGAGTVFGQQAPSRRVVRASIAWQSTRLGQLTKQLLTRLTGPSGPEVWEGMEMFLEQQVTATDPRLQAVYESYRGNLQDIVGDGLEAGAHVLVSSVITNQRDWAPFASQRELSAEAWEQLLTAMLEHQSAGRLQEALRTLQQAAQLDPGFAELQFRLGQLGLLGGEEALARQAFQRALDLDTLRFRADSNIQRITREVATAAGQQVRFIDLAAICAAASPYGSPGSEFLYEHVHLNFAGNYLVGRRLAEEAEAVLSDHPGPGPWLDSDECGRRLALTAWDQSRVLEEMVARLGLPPFSQQMDHTQRLARLEAELRRLSSQAASNGLEQAEEVYQDALAKRGDDWTLRANHARFLQQTSQPKAAEAEWLRLIELVPFYPPGYYGLGNSLDVQGRSAESLEMFGRALELRPQSVEALNGQGLALMNLGRADEAKQRFQEAIKSRPDFAEGWVNLGLLQLRQGELTLAKESFAVALKANPSSVAAHVNLGKTLGLEGDSAGAEKHYREAVRLRPDHAIAHFNLANVLSGRDDPGALQHYAEAVRLEPTLAEAQLSLGLALVKAGQTEKAFSHFERSVQLQPSSAEAHLNFGVALAKTGRLAEAAEQFETCLRLEPNNSMAARFLQQARSSR